MRVFIAGGAGFLASHLVDRLMKTSTTTVTVYDNFSSGRRWHLEAHLESPRLTVVQGDIKDLAALTASMRNHDVVYHLASNPDIARALREPGIDFWEGTYLTHNILEAMREGGVKKIVYASGSGVYGDVGELAVAEDYGPLEPVSTYGASKLAGEALISAYCYMFDAVARVYRFANVVGPRQTHGVGYDFVRRLMRDPNRLHVLGDGQQSKSYIYVEDVLDAIAWTDERSAGRFDVFNVATDDYITVTEIARMAVEAVGLSPDTVELTYSGGRGGWKGDVPVVRFDLAKIRSTGWKSARTSQQAMRHALRALHGDMLRHAGEAGGIPRG